jgi:hypothetical protein
MKQALIITIAFITFNAFGQTSHLKVPLISGNPQTEFKIDTTLKVTYVDSIDFEKSPAYYLNGQFVSETILKTLNPNLIEGISVKNQEIEIEAHKYYGQVFIITKGDYLPKLISLNELRTKYTNLKNTLVIFTIDNEIINEDYDKCIVDENYLLKISIKKIENDKEKLNLTVIQILTKSEENIRKSKEIRIRGLNTIGQKL